MAVTIKINPCPERYNSANPYKTGQTTSYVSNDDGDLQRGRGSDFTTLDFNNPFGNTNRFTDTLGGQTYANDLVLDWGSADYMNKKVPVWDRRWRGAGGAVGGAVINFSTVMALQPISIGGKNYYIPNVSEAFSICKHEASSATNYAPFNLSFPGTVGWTSTTQPNDSARAIAFGDRGVASLAKSNIATYIVLRWADFSEFIP